MIESKIKCDQCGTEKKQTNHWHLLRVNRSGFHVPKTRLEGDRDVCGQACAHILFDRYLTTGKLDKPEVIHPEPKTQETDVVELAIQ
jgi:hypothetical protein